MSGDVHVLTAAARTPVGLTYSAAAAAVRGGISRIMEHPALRDGRGEPVRIARDPRLDPELVGAERLVALARSPFLEIFEQTARSRPLPRDIIVLLAVPEPRPGWSERDGVTLSRALAEQAPPGHRIDVQTVGRGHAGALHAIQEAVRRLYSERSGLVIVGGVDSYLDPTTLGWLEKNRQLRGSDGRWGFFPGEAAAFVALACPATGRGVATSPLARVCGAHSVTELRRIKTDADVLGQGLAAAILGAFGDASSPSEPIDDIYCDINGERYRSDEWAFASLRTQHLFRDVTRYIAPTDCWGDVGAASGVLSCILAVHAWERRCARGPSALAWASSEGGLRSAVLLQQP